MAKKKKVSKVAKKNEISKRTFAKPAGMEKSVAVDSMIISRRCDWVKEIFVRLCIVAVVLFIISICPACKEAVFSINPFWYLAAALIFFGIHITRRRCL